MTNILGSFTIGLGEKENSQAIQNIIRDYVENRNSYIIANYIWRRLCHNNRGTTIPITNDMVQTAKEQYDYSLT